MPHPVRQATKGPHSFNIYGRFAERDVLAKTGSDLKTTADAQHKMGNETARITREHHRRKPDIVR